AQVAGGWARSPSSGWGPSTRPCCFRCWGTLASGSTSREATGPPRTRGARPTQTGPRARSAPESGGSTTRSACKAGPTSGGWRPPSMPRASRRSPTSSVSLTGDRGTRVLRCAGSSDSSGSTRSGPRPRRAMRAHAGCWRHSDSGRCLRHDRSRRGRPETSPTGGTATPGRIAFLGDDSLAGCPAIMARVKAVLIGGTGYGGAEILRRLLFHPHVEVARVTAADNIGKKVGDVHFSLAGLTDLTFQEMAPEQAVAGMDVAFLAMPHKTTAKVVQAILGSGVR